MGTVTIEQTGNNLFNVRISHSDKQEDDLNADVQGPVMHANIGEKSVDEIIDIYRTKKYEIIDCREQGKQEGQGRLQSDEYDMLAMEVLDIPYRILEKERRIAALTLKDNSIQRKTKDITDSIYTDVFNEKEPAQPKYKDTVSVMQETRKRVESMPVIKALEADILAAVTKEKDAGKQKYSNEKLRKDETRKRLLSHEKYKETIENTKLAVVSEKEDPKQKYTNERAREIEVSNRISSHSEYGMLKKKQEEAVKQIASLKMDLELDKRLMRAIEIVTDINKIKLRVY